jgi:hypothetical protein
VQFALQTAEVGRQPKPTPKPSEGYDADYVRLVQFTLQTAEVGRQPKPSPKPREGDAFANGS